MSRVSTNLTTKLVELVLLYINYVRDHAIIYHRHVEELVRLPECFLCYTPSPEAGTVSSAPALANGFITFGSFNNLAKVQINSNYVLVFMHYFPFLYFRIIILLVIAVFGSFCLVR